MRTTKRMLEARMKEFCNAMGVRMGFEPGNWNLDYAACYGGWIVVEFMEDGGENHSLMNGRISARAMHDVLYMATAALTIKNKGQNQ